MTWFVVGAAVVGAAGTAYASHQAAGAQNQATKHAGQVDTTTTNNPYGPSVPYRNDLASRAQGILNGQQYQPAVPPGGSSGGGSQSTGRQATWTNAQGQTVTRNAAGHVVPASGSAGGGGGAASAPFNGNSAATSTAIANASRVAADQEHSAITTAAQNYGAQTLNGVDQNGYRSSAADMLTNLNDPDLQRYKDMLFNSDTGLPGGGSGGAGGSAGGGYGLTPTNFTGYYASNGHGGTVMPDTGSGGGPTNSAQYIRDILAGKDVPGADAMRARIKNSADEAYNQQVQQRRLEAAGSGMYGGTGQLADEAYAQGKYGAGLADAYAQQDYNLYGQALGLGANEDMNALDNATSRSNAALAASTSSGNNAASIAAANQQARLGALGNAVGMGVQQGQFRSSGMGTLADGFSADQRAAAGDAGTTAGLGQAGYLAAGGLSLGGDQARNTYIGNANQLRAAQIAGGNARAALQFQEYTYNREAPLADTARYADILNAAYGNYGSQTTQGFDGRSQTPSYVNPTSQAIAGGVAGYQLGNQIAGSYGRYGGTGTGYTGVVGGNPAATGGTPGNIW